MAGRTRAHRRRADELTCTESEALKALRTATGEIDGDMERHTVRQYLIAERLADTRGIAYDRELLLCASFLHDAGLYGPASSGDVYGHPRPRREGVMPLARIDAGQQPLHPSGSSVRRA